MDFKFLQEVREIVHGLGEKTPRMDTVKAITCVMIKQMTLLIYKTHQAAQQNNELIEIKHLMFILSKHKFTIIRILSFYLLKENILKITSINHSQDPIEYKRVKLCLLEDKSIDNDFMENVLSLDSSDDGLNFDPLKVLPNIDFKSKDLIITKPSKRISLYKKTVSAMVELELDMNITEEEIMKSVEYRQMRINDLSIALSAIRYEEFEICRRKSFHSVYLGEKVLKEAHKSLPPGITYNKDVKEILLFLAKETVATLLDLAGKRITNNEDVKLNSLDPLNEELIKYKVKNQKLITVEDIIAVTASIWNVTSESIIIPSQENINFFTNQLILD